MFNSKNKFLFEGDIEKAKQTKLRLKNDYLPFIQKLLENYAGDKERKDFLLQALKRIEKAIDLINRVFSGNVYDIDDLSILNTHLVWIDKIRETIEQYIKVDDNEYLSTVIASLNEVGDAKEELKKLTLQSNIVRRKREGKEKEVQKKREISFPHYGPLGMIGSIGHSFGVGTGGLIAGGLLSQIVAPVIGPYYGLGIGGLASLLTLPKVLRKSFNFLKGGDNLHDSVGSWLKQVPSTIPQMLKNIPSTDTQMENLWNLGSKSTEKSTGIKNTFLREEDQYRKSKEPFEGSIVNASSTMIDLTSSFSDSLFNFFHKRAYQAAWTRDLLKTIKEKKGLFGEGFDKSSGVVDVIKGVTVVELAKKASPVFLSLIPNILLTAMAGLVGAGSGLVAGMYRESLSTSRTPLPKGWKAGETVSGVYDISEPPYIPGGPVLGGAKSFSLPKREGEGSSIERPFIEMPGLNEAVERGIKKGIIPSSTKSRNVEFVKPEEPLTINRLLIEGRKLNIAMNESLYPKGENNSYTILQKYFDKTGDSNMEVNKNLLAIKSALEKRPAVVSTSSMNMQPPFDMSDPLLSSLNKYGAWK